MLLLPLDFNEVDDASGVAQDASERKFFVNATYEGGVCVRIRDASDIEAAVALVRHAHTVACA